MGKLKPLQVRSLGPGRHGDSGGLYLLVKDTGSRSWLLRVQVNGKRRDIGLGAFPLVSLAEARERALEGRRLAKSGVDPVAAWKKQVAGVPTFAEAAERYHSLAEASWRNAKHRDQRINTLRTYAFPIIGRAQVEAIEAPNIQAVLLPIWRTKPETARRVRQRIATVLDYAQGQGWRASEAPVRAVNTLMKGVKQPRKSNFAALPCEDWIS